MNPAVGYIGIDVPFISYCGKILFVERQSGDIMRAFLDWTLIFSAEIVNVVKQSAAHICNTIKTCTRQITQRLDSINARLFSIENTHRAQLAQKTMQTALLAKMAFSSEHLSADVRYMTHFHY